MATKLTLSIADENIIRKIKSYSRRKRISLSKLTERLYYNIISGERKRKSVASELYGILSDLPADFDWKKHKMERIIKKYS